MTPSAQEITRWLVQWSHGDSAAFDHLTPLVYEELQRIARAYLRRERPGHTLQATALVHEAYLRLIDQRQVSWQNRAHFFGLAARLMRQALIDHARRRQRAKRGEGGSPLTLAGVGDWPAGRAVDLMALDEALHRLTALEEQNGRIIELRFFGGLTVEETAEVLGVSPETVKRRWRFAKAWLQKELKQGG